MAGLDPAIHAFHHSRMFRKIRYWLRHSSRVHLREDGVQNLSDLVELLDRFLFGEMRYPLEWDDFISWDHDNPGIERSRIRIAETE